MGALETIDLVPQAEAPLLHERKAVVVRTHPQTVLGIDIQALDTRDAAGGSDTLERVAVVADETGEASDPYEAVIYLRDGVGLRCRQTAGVVVEHRRETVPATHRVDRGGPVDGTGRVQFTVVVRLSEQHGGHNHEEHDCHQH